MITDEDKLVSVTNEYGRSIQIHDDGYGPLWIMRDSMGICGVVRTRSLDEAWSICEDEICPEASDTVEAMEEEYSTIYGDTKEVWTFWKGLPAWDALSGGQRRILRESGLIRATIPFDSSEGKFADHPCWQECYGIRPNGPRSNGRDLIGHGFYSKDLNGESLEKLTKELADQLSLTVVTAPY